MFDNIHKKVNIPSQERNKRLVSTKKAGRPKAPNMEKVQIKMDRAFHVHVKSYAKKMGVTKSSLITMALKNFIDKSEKRYKLVEC